MKQMRCQEIPD